MQFLQFCRMDESFTEVHLLCSATAFHTKCISVNGLTSLLLLKKSRMAR